MDDYKYQLCEKVQQMPLLWDPRHQDYKDKDQKKQAWEQIEKEIKPYKAGVTVKETWIQMNRAFNSALNRRKKRKSGSGVSSDDKTWKFETAMSFLKVVKTQRTTTCNLDQDNDSEDEPSGDEDANIIEKAADDAGIFQTADDDYQSSSQQQQPNKLSSTQGKPKSKSGKRKVAADSNDDDASNCLYRAVQQRMEDTSKKSPRLKFFESIMPRVDAMSEDGFLEFQIGVLNLLKRSRNEAPNPV